MTLIRKAATDCDWPAWMAGRSVMDFPESWIDSVRHAVYAGKATETMAQWMAFKQRNPQAKMICIDIQPYGTTQGKESSDIINVGGFSDHVFQLIADVAGGRFSENHWVNEISQLRI